MRTDQWIVLLGGAGTIGAILWYFFRAPKARATAVSTGTGPQEATITVLGGYSPSEIHVKAGRPVRLVFDRRETNPCSDEIVIPDFQIRRFLAPHAQTTVDFTPAQAGVFDFQCGMGMLHGKLVVE